MSKEKRFEKWRKVREKGRRNYIIYYGVLGWGLTTGILFFILGQLLKHGLHISGYFTEDWLLTLTISLVCFLFGGILFGYITWGLNESSYHDKYINN